MDSPPAQSMALIPSRILVLGLWTSRNPKIMKKADPDMGRLIQKIHLTVPLAWAVAHGGRTYRHPIVWANTPPIIGPTAPATVKTSAVSPIGKLLSLLLINTLPHVNIPFSRNSPHAKHITNNNIHLRHQPSTRQPLETSSHNQHFHTPTFRCQDRAPKEHSWTDENNWFPSPDIGEFCPDGTRSCVCDDISATYPDVTRCGAEIRYDGGDCCCYNGF